jgi:flagellar motor protein MotB
MPATQTAWNPQDANPPTFESVWASFQEFREGMVKLRESQAESQKEHAQGMQEFREGMEKLRENQAESQKENAQGMQEFRDGMAKLRESQKETDRQMKEYNKRFGEFTKRFGEVVEYMVAPNLCEKFGELGLVFPKANSGTRVSDHENNIHFEIDVMLENGDKALLVEVKTKLDSEDVKNHIKRIEKMRNYADLHGDRRAFLGAVAGVVMASNVKEYALGQGLYVVEPSGETFNITPPIGKPKEW